MTDPQDTNPPESGGVKGPAMSYPEAIAIRSAQLSGKPVADDDAQVALLVIALAMQRNPRARMP